MDKFAVIPPILFNSRSALVRLDKDGRIASIPKWARDRLIEYFPDGPLSLRHKTLPALLQSWVDSGEKERIQSEKVPITSTESTLIVHGQEHKLIIQALESEVLESTLVLIEKATPFSPGSLTSLGLSGRESQVLRLVADGRTNTEVGTILNIGSRTVEKHLSNIFKKLKVSNRAQAIVRVIQSSIASI